MKTDKEWKRFQYRANYNLSTHDYLVEECKADDFLAYCKRHGIENDGGYVFADCFRFVVQTNKVHDAIIRKLYAFA